MNKHSKQTHTVRGHDAPLHHFMWSQWNVTTAGVTPSLQTRRWWECRGLSIPGSLRDG